MPSVATTRDELSVRPQPLGALQVAEVEPLPPVKPPPLPPAKVWTVLFLIYTGIAILLTYYRYLDDLSRNRTGTFAIRTLEEVTGVYTSFVLLPFVLKAADLYLFRRKRLNWILIVFWHCVAGVAFLLAHN
jgi:tryptophan-rich sensory protein